MIRSFLQFRCDGPLCEKISRVFDGAIVSRREALAKMRALGWTRKHGGLDLCSRCSKRASKASAAAGPSLFDQMPESGVTKLSPTRAGAAELSEGQTIAH